jgi:hypothetical protein
MSEHQEGVAVPCCPPLEECERCDVLDFRYRLPFRPVVQAGDVRRIVPVEVTLHFRMTRCPGPLTLGDLMYTTTLLPGEKVRLFTSDRRTRFTLDTETNVAYRHEATSEESFFAAGMANAMSDLSIVENEARTSSFSESSVSGGGGVGIDLGIVEIGGSVSGTSHDASSTSTLARQLSRHAESSSRHVEVAARAASSTSVGEVQTRSHTETESEDHFESSSRTFANPNRCRALSFFFYRIDKCQTVRFELVGIDRRVDDPAAPTGVRLNPPLRTGGVAVAPQAILAASKDRLDVQRRARTALAEERAAAPISGAGAGPGLFLRAFPAVVVQEPLSAEVRRAALEQVDADLVHEGMLDKRGEVSREFRERVGWERTITLPTPGVLVRGCLDQCDVCEPELKREIELELARKELENEMLKRQVELLEKSHEYRCCPQGEAETEGPGP